MLAQFLREREREREREFCDFKPECGPHDRAPAAEPRFPHRRLTAARPAGSGCPSFNSNLQTFARTVPAKVVRHPFVHALPAAVAALIHTTGRGPPPVL